MDRCQANSPQDDIAIARRAFRDGDYKHAVHHLAGALASDPNCKEGLELLDEVLEAGEDSLDLAPIDGPNPPYYGTVAVHARILARRGDVSQAIDLLVQVIHSYPQIPYIDWLLHWLDGMAAAAPLPMNRISRFLGSMIQQLPARRILKPTARPHLTACRISSARCGAFNRMMPSSWRPACRCCAGWACSTKRWHTPRRRTHSSLPSVRR